MAQRELMEKEENVMEAMDAGFVLYVNQLKVKLFKVTCSVFFVWFYSYLITGLQNNILRYQETGKSSLANLKKVWFARWRISKADLYG